MPREHPLENRVPPPVLGLVAAALQHRLPDRPRTTRRRAVAVGVALGAVGLAATADWLFSRSGTTVNPLRPESASSLVTSGPYALTRNPMYVAMAGILLANAVDRGHPAQLLPPAAWVAYVDRFQIRPEERALTSVFGEEYAAYREQVRRWL
jgi:protein-S-isoprenylcysteine O-methyltransferase Ste14